MRKETIVSRIWKWIGIGNLVIAVVLFVNIFWIVPLHIFQERTKKEDIRMIQCQMPLKGSNIEKDDQINSKIRKRLSRRKYVATRFLFNSLVAFTIREVLIKLEKESK